MRFMSRYEHVYDYTKYKRFLHCVKDRLSCESLLLVGSFFHVKADFLQGYI